VGVVDQHEQTNGAGASRRISVAIVGAGISGLTIAQKCADQGVAFTIYEKAASLGGTWRDNIDPGIAVDSGGGTYNLAFWPKYDWKSHFPSGEEIRRYLEDAATRFNIRPFIEFGKELVTARWIDGVWQLSFSDGTDERADVLVMATGFLRIPVLPTTEGRGSFRGPEFHSSQWPRGLSVEGKRVGVIGMGSTAIQIATAIQKERGCRVVQFVRNPQWVMTTKNPSTPWLVRGFLRAWPTAGEWLFQRRLSRFRNSARTGAMGDWRRYPGTGRDTAFREFSDDLDQVKDAELRKRLTPTDAPGCKRIPFAPGYYDAVQKENFTFVRDVISRITPQGIETGSGDVYELDILVYATGFEAHSYFSPVEIFGTDQSQSLSDSWKDGLFSYRNIMVPGYPNLFILHGPYAPINTIVASQSVADQAAYISKVIDHLGRTNEAIAPTTMATENYLKWVRSSLQGTIYLTCQSWYRGTDGWPIVWPFGREEHQAMYSQVDNDDMASY